MAVHYFGDLSFCIILVAAILVLVAAVAVVAAVEATPIVGVYNISELSSEHVIHQLLLKVLGANFDTFGRSIKYTSVLQESKEEEKLGG